MGERILPDVEIGQPGQLRRDVEVGELVGAQVEKAQAGQVRREIEAAEPIEIEVKLGQIPQISGQGQVRELIEEEVEFDQVRHPGGQGEDYGKAAPEALVVLLLFFIAVALLVRSMNKHLRRVPKSFDDHPGSDTDEN